ncbi:XRE family transcriptional regulator [Streptomyces sp. NPDC102274]|uniref:XRE family transcriptional regulator n=1 Tax=Streptomyces sp. NPDC102274 TaxID=3366151 RepID=UPI003802B3AE
MREVDVIKHDPLMYKLVRPRLFADLMQRTGDGSAVSVRELAARSGVARTTIGNLLTGKQDVIPDHKAAAIVRELGVDILVIFAPVGRSVRTRTAVSA